LPEQPVLGTMLTAEMFRELPGNGNPFTILDVVQAEAIGDRFVAAGLNAATPPRSGGLLNSWTQTQIRIVDPTRTDARTGSTALRVRVLPAVSRVGVGAGGMAADDRASALSMTLEPIRAGSTWLRAFEGSVAGSALVAGASSAVPPIDRVEDWADASVAV